MMEGPGLEKLVGPARIVSTLDHELSLYHLTLSSLSFYQPVYLRRGTW